MNINDTLNNNIEKAVQLIEQQKQEIKRKKDEKLRAETRIEENQKGLQQDYDEVEALGFEPDKIDEAIQSLEESLKKYNQDILDILNA